MWDANPDVWSMSAPVMFPVCGGLRDDKFIYEGTTFVLNRGVMLLMILILTMILSIKLELYVLKRANIKKKYIQ